MHVETAADGSTRMKAWPKPRGTSTDPAQILRNAQFSLRQYYSNDPLPEDAQMARTMVAGSPFLYRDILYKQQVGALVEVKTKDGQQYLSKRLTMADAQQMLDSISSDAGTVLYRNSVKWVGLPRGNNGQVLTLNAATGLPDWEFPPGEGLHGATSRILLPPQFDPTQNSGTFGGDAFEAVPLFVTEPTLLTGVCYWGRSFAGGQMLAAGLYGVAPNADLVGAPLLAASALTVPVALSFQQLPFVTPYDIPANTLVWLGLWNKGSSGVTMAALGDNVAVQYFTVSGGALPTTAPGTAGGFGNNLPIWGY